MHWSRLLWLFLSPSLLAACMAVPFTQRRQVMLVSETIDDPDTVNAWTLPGGKVGVYTGIFPVAYDEAGLAIIIGHEVAHALARPPGERLSQGLLVQLGAIGLSVSLGRVDPYTADLIRQAYGLGTALGVMLPFSRAQEAEAERINYF
jgi:metalloendopeptidase OMA1, mitochondrial